MNLHGHVLDDALGAELVEHGAAAGRLAVAHACEPGGTKRLFSFDAYFRAVELAQPALEAHGYATRHVGSALIGSKDGHELQFATASGPDLAHWGAFDPFTSKLRRRAAIINSRQAMPMLPGFPELPISAVLHMVWSFTQADGLVAVHVGMLLPSARNGQVHWRGLTRLPYGPDADLHVGRSLPLGYQDQASSEIRLARRPQARSDAS